MTTNALATEPAPTATHEAAPTAMSPVMCMKRKAESPSDRVLVKRARLDDSALLLLRLLDVDVVHIPPKGALDDWAAAARSDALFMRKFVRDPDLAVTVRMTRTDYEPLGISLTRVRVRVSWGCPAAARTLAVTLCWVAKDKMFAEMHVPGVDARRLAWHPGKPYKQGHAARWAHVYGGMRLEDTPLAEIVMFNLDGARMIELYEGLRKEFPDRFLPYTHKRHCDT